jgi:hypothetical protein
MNSTTEGRKSSRRFAMERALAPHVDQKWAASFILELRLLDIEGSRIGAALSEVESHCSDSGQSAQQAFGDPVDYARSLQLPTPAADSTRAGLRLVEPMVVQVLGMLMLNSSFADWLLGEQVEITTGYLMNQSVVLVGMVAIVRYADPLIRVLVCHPIRMWLAFMASTAIFVLPLIFLDGVIWRVSAGWALAAGGAALAGGVVWAIMQYRADGSLADPITSPFEDAGASGVEAPGSTGSPSEPSRLLTLLGAGIPILMIPVATLMFLAMDLVIHQLSGR